MRLAQGLALGLAATAIYLSGRLGRPNPASPSDSIAGGLMNGAPRPAPRGRRATHSAPAGPSPLAEQLTHDQGPAETATAASLALKFRGAALPLTVPPPLDFPC